MRESRDTWPNGPEAVGAYAYDEILDKLKAELERLIESRTVAAG